MAAFGKREKLERWLGRMLRSRKICKAGRERNKGWEGLKNKIVGRKALEEKSWCGRRNRGRKIIQDWGIQEGRYVTVQQNQREKNEGNAKKGWNESWSQREDKKNGKRQSVSRCTYIMHCTLSLFSNLRFLLSLSLSPTAPIGKWKSFTISLSLPFIQPLS